MSAAILSMLETRALPPPVRCHNCCTRNVSMNIQAMYNLIDNKNLNGMHIQKVAHSTTRVSIHVKRETVGTNLACFRNMQRDPHTQVQPHQLKLTYIGHARCALPPRLHVSLSPFT